MLTLTLDLLGIADFILVTCRNAGENIEVIIRIRIYRNTLSIDVSNQIIACLNINQSIQPNEIHFRA